MSKLLAAEEIDSISIVFLSLKKKIIRFSDPSRKGTESKFYIAAFVTHTNRNKKWKSDLEEGK